MPRLTLRTLLAYIDDTLEPTQARSLGKKVAESDEAKQLIERIKKVTRRRGLRSPVPDGSEDDVSDPNMVAAYLSDNLDSDQLKQLESTCLESDVHLAEVAACHQILTLLLTEPVRVPPTANQRMYLLVPAPASDLSRKPGKAIPVGGVSLPTSEQADSDDPDAAFLLGMKRYAAADSFRGRMKLLAAVGVIGLCLVLAVIMALPHSNSEAPEVSRGSGFALAPAAPSVPPPHSTPETTPAPTPKGPEVGPEPKTAPGTKDTTPPKKVEPATPPKEASSGLGEKKVPPPLQGREVVGKMERPNVIVVSRTPDANSRWLRVDPTEPRIAASSVIMALPGYKADVKLNSNVLVQLWGNLPEQIPEPIFMKPMVMQSRVRFHQVPMGSGLDADLTLEEGRIYLSTTKTGASSRIRVRIATETWDIELPDEKAQVMVQAHSAFVPGTRYPRDGIGGEPPRTEGMVVVTRGTAKFEAPARYAKFPSLPLWSAIAWNSKTDSLVPPSPVKKDEIFPEQDMLIPGDIGVQVQQKLSEAAESLKDRDAIRPLLEARMNFKQQPEFDLARKIATFGYAAIADGVEAEEAKIMAANLYDILKDSERMPVRQAAVTAIGTWMARGTGNTALFVNVLTIDKLIPIEDANLMANLLRGYSAATYGPAAWDGSKIDDLIKFLESDFIPIREMALGSLVYYYDFPAALGGGVKGPPPLVDVGTKVSNYDVFIKDWRSRGEQIKKWMESEVEKKKDKKK